MKRERDSGEIGYWQSMADGIIGLLLVILLVLMLLMLYLIRIEDDQNKDENLGDSYNTANAQHDEDRKHDDKEEEQEQEETDNEKLYDEIPESSSSGGGGDGDTESEDVIEIIETFPEEGSDLAAVFIQLMDQETERTIKKSDIEFELYTDDILQTLATYYPVKTEYKKFRTDSNGGFYLPEKIPLREYQLHELTAVDGYDIENYTGFAVSESYNWDDPYVVNVYLTPSKNSIQIRLRDSSDGKNLSFGKFQIIAAEDIVTKDGTTRYAKDTVVDTVSIGSDGTGESAELYLGKYIVRQSEAQKYYALIKEDETVDINNKNKTAQGEICSLTEEKTTVNVVVEDELYSATRIEDATIELQDKSGKVLQSAKTDDKGTVCFTDLDKNVTYQISQKNTDEGYQLPNNDSEFFVDKSGYVNGAIESEVKVTNRIIRVSIGVVDRIFQNQVSDVSVALLDGEDKVIKTWNSSGVEQVITGLTPGVYRIVINGNSNSTKEIVVQNKADIQSSSFYIVTVFDIGFVCSVIAFIIIMIIIGIYIHRRKKMNKFLDSEE